MTFDDLPGVNRLAAQFNEGIKTLEALNWLKDSTMVSVVIRPVQTENEEMPAVIVPVSVAFANTRNMVQWMGHELERLGVKPPPIPLRCALEERAA